jgi:GT2 family glycosyltransferase
MYFEELDYFVRVQRAGWHVECEPAARAWQEPGRKPAYLWTRNRLRFLARNAPRRKLIREVAGLLVRATQDLGTDSGGASRRRSTLIALVHFLLRRTGAPPERFRPMGSALITKPQDGLSA